MRLLARLWLGGDFSITRETITSRKQSSNFRFEKTLPLLGLSLPINSHKLLLWLVNSLVYIASSFTTSELETFWYSDETRQLLLNKEHRKNNKLPRGAGGLTQYGKKMVRSCCQLIDNVACHRPIGLLTNTLPSMSRELLDVATEKWSEICRQFNQELTRELIRHGLPSNYCFVTEWQAKRQALHMHIVFIASNRTGKLKGSDYPITKQWYKETWQRVLNNVLGFEFDCSAATRIERVKYSVGAYMSKYMSKGDSPKRISAMQTCTQYDTELMQTSTQNGTKCDTEQRRDAMPASNADIGVCNESSNADMHICITESSVELSQHCQSIPLAKHPSAWWGASTKLKRKVREAVLNISIKISEDAHFHRQDGFIAWLEPALKIANNLDSYWQKIVVVGCGIPMGITGRMKPKGNYLEMFKMFTIGTDLSRQKIMTDSDYWRWRYKRDGCNPDHDQQATQEWIYDKYSVAISYGLP